MVSAWEPECGVASHTLPADKDILQGLIKGVTHVELSRDVRRGDNDSVWFFLRVNACLEALVVHPVFINFVLYLAGFVELRKLSFHINIPPFRFIYIINYYAIKKLCRQ